MDQATLLAMIQAEFAENRKNLTTQVDRIQGNLTQAQREYRQDGAALKGEIATMQKVIEDKLEEHKNKQEAIKLEDRQERGNKKEEILTTARAELINADNVYRLAEQERSKVFNELSNGAKETQNLLLSLESYRSQKA